jgi:hypothetical protein
MGGQRVITLIDLLETTDDFRSASLGLVAWELMVDEPVIDLIWIDALADGLIRPASPARFSDGREDEDFFALTERGRQRLDAAESGAGPTLRAM